MANLKYEKEITALIAIDPHNEFATNIRKEYDMTEQTAIPRREFVATVALGLAAGRGVSVGGARGYTTGKGSPCCRSEPITLDGHRLPFDYEGLSWFRG